ncbi:LysR family transcriptional regulator [Phenylobacterium sp.]|uniref:LysR family transcriptional regulator n=1 Tax=Phenylobacterium sp. TaxID=1871053 RepID=UPI0025D92EF0|nr:LysR family transcriptional regulator [Phenylobacterium sp.]
MRQVLAIHRHGSFVKAADDIGVAQPTLSKSISRLEDELGIKLFDRTGSGAKVTPMGALLVGRAETIIAEAERLARDIELVAAGQIGEARIGIGPALRWFLPPFAEALTTRWPSLRLHLNVDMRDRLLADLKAGALDLVITARTLEFGSDYVHTEILREPVVAAASPDHPLAQLDHVTVAEFLRYPNAGASEPSILTAPGAQGADPGIQQESLVVCNDDTTLKLLASRGLVTLLSNQKLVQAELDSGELVRLPLAWQMTISFVAVMTRATSHSPIFREIVGLAQDMARR